LTGACPAVLNTATEIVNIITMIGEEEASMSLHRGVLRMATAAVALAAGLAFGAVAWAQGEWKAPPEAHSLKNPIAKFDAKAKADAKNIVETNCVPCHGVTGKGDGPAAAALPPPKPANWTGDAVPKQTDGEIFWKITNGRGAMPPWKHLPDNERWEIVNYIRTLKGK